MILAVWLAKGALAACPTPSPARTVCALGCTDTTIAAAVTNAVNNDVICVSPGSYTDRIFLNTTKRVRVEADGQVTVEVGSGSEMIRVESGGDLELVGIDIVGNTSRRCAFITSAGSSLRLEGVEMSQCRQNIDGAGIFLDGGTSATIEDSHRTLLEKGVRRISPFFVPSLIVNLAPGQISLRYGMKGPTFSGFVVSERPAHTSVSCGRL